MYHHFTFGGSDEPEPPHTERYRVRREVLSRKIDRFYEIHDQLAPEDPGRAKILDQIDALEIAYNVEE